MWSPLGVGPRVINRDDTFVSGRDGRGLRLQVTPDGDCREAVFTAKGAGLQVPPLSSVQIEYDLSGEWVPLFYGEVRQGGNARNVDGEDYVLRGLAQRLREVVLPPGFATPKQPAHLTVRALIIALIGSGALGRGLTGQDEGPIGISGGGPLVEYDADLCPDLGFDCRAIVDVSGAFASTILEQIAQDGAGLGVNVVFGVRPDRRFFCKPARTDTVEPASDDVIHVNWTPPQAETPYTLVQWFVAKRTDGTWVKHTSRSSRVFDYGERVKPVPLDASATPWFPVPAAYTLEAGVFPSGYSNMDVLRDGKFYRDAPLSMAVCFHPAASGGGVNADMVLTLTPSGTFNRVVIDGLSFGSDVGLFVAGQSIPLGPLVPGPRIIQVDGSGPVTLTLPPVLWPDVGGQINLYEFRVDRLDTSLLDRMAERHYVHPAQEPADIELWTFRRPADLAGRIRLSDYERAVEVWEYRLTNARGLTLGALTGQADDPYKLAQADLLKRQSNNATISAITATG